MSIRFIHFLLLITALSFSNHIFALSAQDVVFQIQKKAIEERLLDETKDVIAQGKIQSVVMNRFQIMKMVDEIAKYNALRQRSLPPVLAYIVENKKHINTLHDPLLDTLLESYMKDRYVRYFTTKSYEELKRSEQHEIAVASLPKDIDIPSPRTSDTYQSIVVDISDQRLYAFEDNILVATSLITSGKKGFGTIQGDFDVKKKQTNRILNSPFKNPNIQYRLHVDYWIQFYKGFGIHDACNSKSCWRKEFGESDYISKGSHGCVNTPYEFMSWIYEWVLPKTRVSVIK